MKRKRGGQHTCCCSVPLAHSNPYAKAAYLEHCVLPPLRVSEHPFREVSQIPGPAIQPATPPASWVLWSQMRTLQAAGQCRGVGVVLSPASRSCCQAGPQGTTCGDEAVSTPHGPRVICLLLRSGKLSEVHSPTLGTEPLFADEQQGRTPAPGGRQCSLLPRLQGRLRAGAAMLPLRRPPQDQLTATPKHRPPLQWAWAALFRGLDPPELSAQLCFHQPSSTKTSQPLPDTLPRAKQAPRTKITIR